ncbi:MAG TPA: GntR family transcriptional regulator [Trebonia sp.]|nr:GntR family transcriptional regulator [Trebonia sp.]
MTEPMYRQIADDLRAQIESGAIAQGAKLPTESELRVGYGAARNTVREAVKLLSSRGLVESRPGLGTFVTRSARPFVTTLAAAPLPEAGGAAYAGALGDSEGTEAVAGLNEQGRTPSASGPLVTVQTTPDDVAVWLGISPGTQVVSRRWEWFADGRPWSLRTSYYPFEFVASGATDLVRAEGLPGGSVAYLERRLGLVQVGYRESILARPPASDEAKFLELPDDGRGCVVTVARASYRQGEGRLIPFRVTVTVLPADRIVLVINSGEVPDLADHTAPEVA